MTIETEFLFSMQGTLVPLDLGAGPEGARTILSVSEGTVSGPALSGRIVPGTSADWARVRPDGSFAVDVRLVIEADNGDLIYVTYGGRIVAETPEAQQIALDFEKPDPEVGKDQYYFRINPLFETASTEYAWMNKIIAVGTGMTGAGGVKYLVYKIK